MRKQKEFQVNDGEKIIIKEFRIGDILNLQEHYSDVVARLEKAGNNVMELFAEAIKIYSEYFSECLILPAGKSPKNLLNDLSFSEIKEIYRIFSEVNSDFLGILEFVGIQETLNRQIQKIRQDARKLFVLEETT